MDDAPAPKRFVAASGGFLGPGAQARRIRRILALAGAAPRLRRPRADDVVLAWGHALRARRAEWLAEQGQAQLWRIEDAFIRSILPARQGAEPPAGLLLDRGGIHYDPSRPSDLETLLQTQAWDDGHVLGRAKICLDRIRALHLSKYNGHDPHMSPPAPGYVLIVDQVRGDASLTHGGLTGPLPAERLFREMLFTAMEEHPNAPILIRAHPETTGGARPGHYSAADAQGRVQILSGNHSPWSLLEGAIAVYTVSSQLGFEAILAGHRPRVFGHPFYAGWGLSDDREPTPRRTRKLTRLQLFAGAMMLYPLWYDPFDDRLCALEEVIDQFEARLRVWREDASGYVGVGVRAWKRGFMQDFFGTRRAMRFAPSLAKAEAIARADGRRVLGWASALPDDAAGLRTEDGFLRSRGLGAALTPPVSLALDETGIYYDPTHESALERLIPRPLPPGGAERVAWLREHLIAGGLTKYNLPSGTADLGAQIAALRARRPTQPVILVPGQVEDDASIRYGAAEIRTNRALLEAVRGAKPEAIIAFKPHPDVEAGLRPGTVANAEVWADIVLSHVGADAAMAHADQVWTLTSGLGFEALLRGLSVTCLGMPFYAGWGLTRDWASAPARRLEVWPKPSLEQLIHAALIDYPRYVDPVTRQICPVETVVRRLATGQPASKPVRLRLASKVQGWFAGYAHLWR